MKKFVERSIKTAKILVGMALPMAFTAGSFDEVKGQTQNVVVSVRTDLSGCVKPATAPYFQGSADIHKTPAEYATWFIANQDTLRKCYEANQKNYEDDYEVNWDFDTVLDYIKAGKIEKVVFPAGTEFEAMSSKNPTTKQVHVAENTVCYSVPVAGFVPAGLYLKNKKTGEVSSFVGFMHCGQKAALPKQFQDPKFLKGVITDTGHTQKNCWDNPSGTCEGKLNISAQILTGDKCAEPREVTLPEFIDVDVVIKRKGVSQPFEKSGVINFGDSALYVTGSDKMQKGDEVTVSGSFPKNSDLTMLNNGISFVVDDSVENVILFACEKKPEPAKPAKAKKMWVSFGPGATSTVTDMDTVLGRWVPNTDGYGVFYSNVDVLDRRTQVTGESIQYTGDATNGMAIETVGEYGGERPEFVIDDVSNPQNFSLPFVAKTIKQRDFKIGAGAFIPIKENINLNVGGFAQIIATKVDEDPTKLSMAVKPVIGIDLPKVPVYKGFVVGSSLSAKGPTLEVTNYFGGKSIDLGVTFGAGSSTYEHTGLSNNVSQTTLASLERMKKVTGKASLDIRFKF